AGCDRALVLANSDGPVDSSPPDTTVIPECAAQRALYLVGGNGGLAWFTLEWPIPSVITGFRNTFAFDDPANAKDVTTDPLHPLFARQVGDKALWEGLGAAPQPSVFIAGTNETHVQAPRSIMLANGISLAASVAAHQSSLRPVVPVIEFVPNAYG